MRDFEEEIEDLAAELPDDASLRDGIAAFLDDNELEGDPRRVASFALNQILVELFESGPPGRMSLRAWLESEYTEYAGGNHVLPGGYARVVDALAEGLDVRLNRPVARVAHGADGVTVANPCRRAARQPRDRHRPARRAEGRRDRVRPAAAEAKRAAMARLDMGDLEKVVLRFEEPFWRERAEGSTFLYIGEPPGAFTGFTDWSDEAGAPTLVCLTGGRSARSLLERWTDEEIARRAAAVVREVFGDDTPDPDRHVRDALARRPVEPGLLQLPARRREHRRHPRAGAPVGERLLFAARRPSR